MNANSSQRPVLVLSGTTASGKNRVGVRVAEELGGEILSLDSMKVYRGMDMGTDKPSVELRAQVPHHLVDILDPLEGMNLSRFVTMAEEADRSIRETGALPVAVGGTALYLKALLWGLLEVPPGDPALREHELGRVRYVDARWRGRLFVRPDGG